MYIRNPELLGAKLVTYICMGAFMGAPPSHLSLQHDPLLGAPECTQVPPVPTMMGTGRLYRSQQPPILGVPVGSCAAASSGFSCNVNTVSVMRAAAAGSMYLRQPLDTATAAYNRSAALWVAMFAFMLMPSETACSVWCQERAVVGLIIPLLPALASSRAGLAAAACPACSQAHSWLRQAAHAAT